MSGQNSHEHGRQWLRDCSLAVAGQSGQALELGALRVVFATHKGDSETPNSAEIRVYNLSESTASRMQREFTRVVLQAGYKGNISVIFDGNIRQFRKGREGVDSYMEIIAADGDRAYNFAMVNTTLASGSRPEDRVKACQKEFQAKGVQGANLPDLGGNPLPRGKVLYGPAKKYMRNEAENTGCSWSFQDGSLTMVKTSGYLPGEAVVLTHETGLIGTPEQTNEGIKARCLLNPRLRVNGRIKLNNASIQAAKTDIKAAAKRPPGMDRDGFYRIIKVEFSGDTHGQDWYADMVCIGLDDTSNTPLDLTG
jgi:hypothetical protein